MSDAASVWVVDDDDSIRWVLERALARAGMRVRTFSAAGETLTALHRGEPDVMVADVRMPGLSGLELLQRVQSTHPHLPVIVTTAHSDLDSAVAAYRGGAFEYLPKPFDVDEAVALVRRAAQHRAANGASDTGPESDQTTLIGEAPAMQAVFRAIGRLSQSNISVLITGESGTGKELIARALHQHSPRAARPFIAVNTAAIPKDLMESEFFGHERGAFTGAQNQRRGRFEQADGGTLFLDEIGDMPAELQTRLLRVLADGQFYRVGGHVPLSVDVRVIAATNQDLEGAVQRGAFREDLYHRLNVIRVRVPALRERREDIPALVEHFLQRAARELHAEPKRVEPDAQAHLSRFDWPGNVRQLENVCRWLTVMAPGRGIHVADLPPELRGEAQAPSAAEADGGERGWLQPLERWARSRLVDGSRDLVGEAVPALERVLIRVALERSGGHRQDAAKLLGWGRNTLTRKIRDLSIDSGSDAG